MTDAAQHPLGKRWRFAALTLTMPICALTGTAIQSRAAHPSPTCRNSGSCARLAMNHTRAGATDSLFDDYSTLSPHWSHIRTMVTDFYFKWTPGERQWAGRHYDYAMAGNTDAWKAVNPRVGHYKYMLLQATILPKHGYKGDLQSGWYPDMREWYARHPRFDIERAFLHRAGQPADSAHRLTPWGWDSKTWIINPADSGLIEYTADRFARAAVGEDGLFVDSQGSGGILNNMKGSLEYPEKPAWPPVVGPYAAAYVRLIAAVKHAIGSRVLMLNTGPYRFAPDSLSILAAGATHMEKTNDPMSSDLPATWKWIDKLLAMGELVDFVSTRDYDDMPGPVKRHYDVSVQSAFWRLKLADLASYYMVVPEKPDHLALQLCNAWSHPFSTIWLRAQEADIGHPTEPRHLLTEGVAKTDPAGQRVQVFERDFDRALVLIRVQTGFGAQIYGDTTAVTIPLPIGEAWLPLGADGSLGSAVTSVELHNADAVILIKSSTIADTAPEHS